MRIPSRSDSSRRSPIPSIRLSLTRSAIFSSRLALFTWYGSSVTMIAVRSPLTSSNATWARMTTRPRPWAYIWRIASTVSHSPVSRLRCFSKRKIVPPVGKSGPGTYLHRSSEVRSGSSIRAIVASAISPRWWGGMFVAIPTAMPGAAVDEQVRELGRQDRRLLLRAVVVVDEVDGLLVDVGEHLAGDRGQPRLRVAHRGRARRRRPSRSCPGRRRAGSASRSPGRAGRGRRTGRCRRAGGTCPSPRRRSRRTCGTSSSPTGPSRPSRRGSGDGPA